MFGIWKIILSLSVIVHKSWETPLKSDMFYNAGVVEFKPSFKLTDNLNGYLEIITSAKAKSLDILVFPESTLNDNAEATFVPDPLKTTMAPCDSTDNYYHDLLIKLSCAARNSSTYLVINLSEKENCSQHPEDKRPCAASGLNIFNTNVVFDRSGIVISRYRKVNLYGENKNTTLVPEFGWFDTDFGVRFGHFICFDILFYSPAQEMAEKFDIRDFVFSTMWFSQLPFLTAVQFHQSWSYGNDVNFLAAGASYPEIGNTGSGIYNGRQGILVATMEQKIGQRTLLSAQVPKFKTKLRKSQNYRRSSPNITVTTSLNSSSPVSENMNLNLKTDHLQSYHSFLIDISKQTTLSQNLCFNDSSFCCQFDLKWQQFLAKNGTNHYHYRLGVFDGQRYEKGIDSNQLKNCAVFSCAGPDILDCGKLQDVDLDVVFENITITAQFPKTKTFLLMPNSLRHKDLMPLSVQDFEWHEESIEKENSIRVRYSLTASTSNLMAFSIYGNYYGSCF